MIEARKMELESENRDIVKKIRNDMQDIKEDWFRKASEGVLNKSFVDRAYTMPEAAFVSEFLNIKPDSAKDIETLIRNGLISGNCYDCTDNQGFDEAWAYQMNDKAYYVELSYRSEMPHEQQAAEQIFQLYRSGSQQNELKLDKKTIRAVIEMFVKDKKVNMEIIQRSANIDEEVKEEFLEQVTEQILGALSDIVL